MAGDGMVGRGRGEVLAEGQEGDAGDAEVAESGQEVVFGFAQAQHEAGFGAGAAVGGGAEDGQGSGVGGLGADDGMEAGRGFEVVVEDVGAGVEDGLEGAKVAAEVGDEDFGGGEIGRASCRERV